MTNILGTKLYTVKEGRDMLGIGKNKMYNIIRKKEIEYVNLAGVKHLTDEGIKNYIARNTVKVERPNLITRN